MNWKIRLRPHFALRITLMLSRHLIDSASRRASAARVLALALFLLVSQWLLVQHQSDLHSHTAEHACDLCLIWQTLDDVVPVTARPVPPSPTATSIPVAANRPAAGNPVGGVFARGPPGLFS